MSPASVWEEKVKEHINSSWHVQRNYFIELKELAKTIPEPLAIGFDNSGRSPRNPERSKHTACL